jgi:hypothetical protein
MYVSKKAFAKFTKTELMTIASLAQSVWQSCGMDFPEGENTSIAAIVDFVADQLYDGANPKSFNSMLFQHFRENRKQVQQLLLRWRDVKYAAHRQFYKNCFSGNGVERYIDSIRHRQVLETGKEK